MNVKENKNLQFIDGVNVSISSRAKFEDFEKNYLLTREKEKRILSIEEIKLLPFPKTGSSDYGLWKIRRKNIKRFEKYISHKEKGIRILDIGCGNGFFTNILAMNGNKVVGLDVNLTELKQAASAFPGKKINWYYLDILNETLPEENFDIITFNASFHYFKEPATLLKICLALLKPKGEIHILDSPFYPEQFQKDARQRSLDYFKSMGAESMSNYYYHNTFGFLNEFNYFFKYKPNKFLNKIFRLKDSPFPWVMITSS